MGGRGYVVFLGGMRLWGGVFLSPRGRGVGGDGSCFLEGSLDFSPGGASALILSNGH